MPPKPKYTKDEIVQAAFELAREEGIESVVARSVGKRLGTSASPIFTVFNSMDELKEEVVKKAKQICLSYMDGIFDYEPAFKEYGLRLVQFSIEEPHLYHLLFLNRKKKQSIEDIFPLDFNEMLDPLLIEVQQTFGISEKDAESLLNQLLIHSNGIASFCQYNHMEFTREQVSASISQICIGLVVCIKLRDGSFVLPQAQAMAASAITGVLPQKKEK